MIQEKDIQSVKTTASFTAEFLFHWYVLKYTKHWHLPIQRQQRQEIDNRTPEHTPKSHKQSKLQGCSITNSHVNQNVIIPSFYFVYWQQKGCWKGPDHKTNKEINTNILFYVKPRLATSGDATLRIPAEHQKHTNLKTGGLQKSHSRTLQKYRKGDTKTRCCNIRVHYLF